MLPSKHLPVANYEIARELPRLHRVSNREQFIFLMSSTWITLNVLLCFTVESIDILISSPRHGATLDIVEGRTNGGIDFEISVVVETATEYIRHVDGRHLCLYINGSADSVDCVAMKTAQGLVIPSTAWRPGQTWLHLELLFSAGLFFFEHHSIRSGFRRDRMTTGTMQIVSAPILVSIFDKSEFRVPEALVQRV